MSKDLSKNRAYRYTRGVRGNGIRVGILDAEFSHQQWCTLLIVSLFTQREVFFHHDCLFRQRWRQRHGTTLRKRLGLFEDPWITNGATGDGDAIDPGFADHLQAILGTEEITAAEYFDAIAYVLLDIRQERPATGTNVPLRDGTTVYCDASQSRRNRAIEYLEKLLT